jgi:hypothetical protein
MQEASQVSGLASVNRRMRLRVFHKRQPREHDYGFVRRRFFSVLLLALRRYTRFESEVLYGMR